MQASTSKEERLRISELTEEETVSEISERIRCARLWCQKYWRVLCSPDLRCRVKFQLYKIFVRSILTYGSEVWCLGNRMSKKLLRFECEILLSVYKSKYPHRHPKRLRPSIAAVYKRYRNADVVDHVNNERLSWNALLEIEEKAVVRNSEKTGRRVHWWDQSKSVMKETGKKKANGQSIRNHLRSSLIKYKRRACPLIIRNFNKDPG